MITKIDILNFILSVNKKINDEKFTEELILKLKNNLKNKINND